MAIEVEAGANCRSQRRQRSLRTPACTRSAGPDVDPWTGGAMTLLKLRDTDLHWREIDGEIIALEAQGSRYVAANGAGTVLWRALAAGTTRDDMADELVGTYGIDRE